MASYKQLTAQLEKLHKEVAVAREKEIAQAIADIRQKVAEYDLTAEELGFTAERIVAGEADVAIQQLSELKQVEGVEIVGALPHHLQTPALFSAGRMTSSKQVAAADLLLRFLSSPEVTPVLIESGLERLA